MAGHHVAFSELVAKLEHLKHIEFACIGVQRYVNAENQNLVLRHVCQVLSQPFQLVITEAAAIDADFASPFTIDRLGIGSCSK